MKQAWISSSQHDDLHEFLGSTSHVFFRRRQCIWAFVEVWENSMMPEVYKRLVLESPCKNCIISKVSSVLSCFISSFGSIPKIISLSPKFIHVHSWVFWNGFSSRLTVCEFEVKGQSDSAWVLGCPCFKSLPSIASIFFAVWIHWHKKGQVIKFRTHGMNEHVLFSSKNMFQSIMFGIYVKIPRGK